MVRIDYISSWDQPVLKYGTAGGRWDQAQFTRGGDDFWSVEVQEDVVEFVCWDGKSDGDFGFDKWQGRENYRIEPSGGHWVLNNGQLARYSGADEAQPEHPASSAGAAQEECDLEEGWIKLIYESGWQEAYLHCWTEADGWTTKPGNPMVRNDEGMWTFSLKASKMVFACNDGQKDWDNNDGRNYEICSAGEYILRHACLTRTAKVPVASRAKGTHAPPAEPAPAAPPQPAPGTHTPSAEPAPAAPPQPAPGTHAEPAQPAPAAPPLPPTGTFALPAEQAPEALQQPPSPGAFTPPAEQAPEAPQQPASGLLAAVGAVGRAMLGQRSSLGTHAPPAQPVPVAPPQPPQGTFAPPAQTISAAAPRLAGGQGTNLGLKEALTTLEEDFRFNPRFCAKVRELADPDHGFQHWRRVRGDGNCFYRAFGFGLLEQIIEAHGPRRQAWARSLNARLAGLSFKERDEQEAHRLLLQCVAGLAEGRRMCDGSGAEESELLWASFQDTSARSLDLALIRALRALTAQIVVNEAGNPDLGNGLPLRDLLAAQKLGTPEEFARTVVLPMGKEAETVIMNAIVEATGVGVRLAMLDSGREASSQLNFQEYKARPGDDGTEPPMVQVQFRPGHFDLHYR